ncbi:conserved hypothetical protein, secreted [Candidatus Omnitrophus magneticus]|uniref:Uncharacterized protein n=1 Tax=Candidatus Omnitrophus magneticus TaxID=1609969 RepID=A0A0F0CQ28_9BACT|nr:conserved hypothetical protein, secreted [Candidatus Omnitrophus magneticus]
MKFYKLLLIFSTLIIFANVISSLASDEPDKTLQKAIWNYKHENYEESYDALLKLLKENPNSSIIAYYLGMVSKKLEKYDTAKTYFEKSITLSPKIKNAILELMDLDYKKGKFNDVSKWIAVAEKENIFPAQTSFFKGLLLLKESKDIDSAIKYLEQAKTIDPSLTQTVDYHLGMACIKKQNISDAKQFFKNVIVEGKNSNLATFAEQYLSAIARKEDISKPLHGNISTTVQYDDNVILSPDENIIAISPGNTDDFRAVYTLDGTYNIKLNETVNNKFGYALYAAKQFDLGFYDMLSHTFFTQPSISNNDILINFPCDYTYLTINDKGYLSSAGIGSEINKKLDASNMGQIGAGYKYKDFLWPALLAGENKDSNEYSVYGAWFYFFQDNKAFVSGKYTINYDNTEESNWRYLGNKFSAVTAFPIIEKVKAGTLIDLCFQNFTDTNLLYYQKRHDIVASCSSFLLIDIFKNTELKISYTFINDSSNIQIYTYKRNIYSAGVKYKF